MKALVTIENKDEIVEDFELNREFDKVTIDVSNGSKFYIKVTRDGNLEIVCAEGPGLFGTQLAVAPKISNVLVVGAGREFV